MRAIGCALGPSLQALREYGGEPHRTERVATVDAVEYYDDSKGTNVGATLAAIQGLASESRKLVVILGGDGKQQRFEPLAGAVAAHARAVVLIGRDGPRIGQACVAEKAGDAAHDGCPSPTNGGRATTLAARILSGRAP